MTRSRALLVITLLVLTVGAGGGATATPVGVDRSGGDRAGDGWRTERWQGAQVRVPQDYRWGTAPQRFHRDTVVCGTPPDEPYVGRPILESDLCQTVDLDQPPDVASVWLGVDLPSGVVDLGGGWTRETREVAGTTVTMTSTDDALRAEVLDSARPVRRCAASLERPPKALRQVTDEGYGDLVAAELCVYRRDRGPYRLVYGTGVGERLVSGTERVVDRSRVRREPCPGRPGELVVVTAHFADPFGPGGPDTAALTHRVVYEMGSCSQVRFARYFQRGQVAHRLTEATVVPWAGERYRHLVVGPYTQWAYRYFIGVQG